MKTNRSTRIGARLGIDQLETRDLMASSLENFLVPFSPFVL